MLEAIEKTLAGWPSTALSILLIVVGLINIAAGLFAPAIIKLPIAIWAVA